MKKFIVIVGLYASRLCIFAKYSISVEARSREEAEKKAEEYCFERYDCEQAITLEVH